MRNALLLMRAWAVALIVALAVIGAEAARISPRWYKGNLHTHMRVSDGIVLEETVGTRTSYRLKGDDLYVRAKVMTPNGVAWTQPYVRKMSIRESVK